MTIEQEKQAIMYRKTTGKSTLHSQEKVQQVLDALDIDVTSLQFLHIAGTNGKGSTTNFLRSILQEAAYSVGTFTSPFLVEYNDRIRINNANITDEALSRLVKKTRPYWDEFDLGMFEISTIIALIYFYEEQPDVVILETGIGGRLDATNFIRPLASIITNVSFDHMSILGNTISKIAREKAGIIKTEVPVITGKLHVDAHAVVQKVAQEKNAPFDEVHQSTITSYHADSIEFVYRDMHYQLQGQADYQVLNASLALEVAIVLREKMHINVSDSALHFGIANALWAGRFEEVLPFVYLDGAHNEAGTEALIQTINRIGKKTTIVLAILKDKSATKMVRQLQQLEHTDIVLTSFDFGRPFHTEAFAAELSLEYDGAMQHALEKAVSTREASAIVVVTGSLYFISEARKFLLDTFKSI